MDAYRSFSEGMKIFNRLEKREQVSAVTLLNAQWPRRGGLAEVAQLLAKSIVAPRVFLSHSHEDKKFVRRLATRMHRAGIKVWLDEAEIKVGESLVSKLSEAIERVDFVVVVLSLASINSEWVRREVELALNQEIAGRKVKVLPILKETVPLPGFLVGKLYIDFSEAATRGAAGKRLIEDILRHEREIFTRELVDAANGPSKQSRTKAKGRK